MRKTKDSREDDDLSMVVRKLIESRLQPPFELLTDRMLARCEAGAVEGSKIALGVGRPDLAIDVPTTCSMESTLLPDLVQGHGEEPAPEALGGSVFEVLEVRQNLAADGLDEIRRRLTLPKPLVGAQADEGAKPGEMLTQKGILSQRVSSLGRQNERSGPVVVLRHRSCP